MGEATTEGGWRRPACQTVHLHVAIRATGVVCGRSTGGHQHLRVIARLGLMAIGCQHAPMQQPDIRPVDLEVVLPLRRSVLRAGIPDPVVVFGADRDPSAVHVAVFDRGQVVGVSSLVPDPRPGGHPDGLRIRMVGVLPGHRSGGIGRRLVEACVDHSGAAPEVWLAARRHLEGWYGSMGFVTVGDPYDKPPTGIHVDMVRLETTD